MAWRLGAAEGTASVRRGVRGSFRGGRAKRAVWAADALSWSGWRQWQQCRQRLPVASTACCLAPTSPGHRESLGSIATSCHQLFLDVLLHPCPVHNLYALSQAGAAREEEEDEEVDAATLARRLAQDGVEIQLQEGAAGKGKKGRGGGAGRGAGAGGRGAAKGGGGRGGGRGKK